MNFTLRTCSMLLLGGLSTLAWADQKTFTIQVTNPSNTPRVDAPVVLNIHEMAKKMKVRSAIVMENGQEIASQVDDFDRDGKGDELAFVVNLKSNEKKTFSITLSTDKATHTYPPRVYAEMIVKNPKDPVDNTVQRLYIHSLTVDGPTNPYNAVHHHGPAFESELIGLRLYFDHRQTVDQYGKLHKGLELKDTQFYTTKEQKAAGYGDDVLWAGNTVSVGTFRGWNGTTQTMIEPVERRTERILAYGPIRTVTEIYDEGWETNGSITNMTQRYTLYAGHRDVQVDVFFSTPMNHAQFCTGTLRVAGGKEYIDPTGTTCMWGGNWTVAPQDTIGREKEVIGLAVTIPQQYVKEGAKTDKDNIMFVMSPTPQQPCELHYHLAMAYGKEDFGYRNFSQWQNYVLNLKDELSKPLIIKKGK